MKAFLLLFSIYLLALGCLPCADSECAANKPEVAASASHSGDCHSEETCPPFCTCACCSMHIAAPGTASLSVAPLQLCTVCKTTFTLHQPLLSRAGNSIWQPPRLG